MIDGKGHTYSSKDGQFKVEAREYHIFDADFSTNEDVILKVNALPEDGATDERFFRNLFGYLEDCYKAGVKPSMFQMLLFLHDADASIALTKVPGGFGRFIGKWILGFIGGKVIGEKLLGYRSSYKEYYCVNVEGEKKGRQIHPV